MTQDRWQALLLAQPVDEPAWELFHENSKTTAFQRMPSDSAVLAAMAARYDSLPFDTYPATSLPESWPPLSSGLGEVIVGRRTARTISAAGLSFGEMAAILQYSHGVSRDNVDGQFPRPFRVTPSAGALYPLEIYLCANAVAGLRRGLYHYNPSKNNLRLLAPDPELASLEASLVDPSFATAPLLIFFTVLFERSTFKYGDRGYRFALLEAGHIAQNANLVAGALGLGYVNIGGFHDQRADALLDLDGLCHSTVYMGAVTRLE